ncbi:hypothetical protein PFLUV_G00092680 [Perca fluviatilis]|uniref:IRS-type PTB domain-containing protein n=1 Tax=Perca fluviatilis TaxID=8168 RepID=A0A6A5EB17_PERFL|nr:hypothetical protein PFLUV_G00092680 [Perca fluviatilis]
MGSCLSCPEKESIPDNHQSKFKVINVDDDGNELGSGVMELTDAELVLHTHRRDDVRWPYLCLRRYGYDSNLFSFESGRRCQTGQALGYSVPSVPNGVSRIPSVGEAPSHPSSRHPSVASTRLPSVGEESTHPLLVADDAVHTYVNTVGLLEEQPSPLTPPRRAGAAGAGGVPAALAPPVQRQLMEQEKRQQENGEPPQTSGEPPETNGHAEDDQAPPPQPEAAAPPPLANGSTTSNPSAAPRRHRPPPLTPDLQNVNNSAQRRTALLDYENLPALPPVWEARKASAEDEENHSYSHPLSAALESSHNYVNTENVTAPLSAHRPDTARRRTDAATVFNFDFRRLPAHAEPPKTLNYIEVEMDAGAANRGASDGSNPHTPRTPTSPLPPSTPTRRTELYALIDIERTAAMSNLQKARPRDDGTSRKTRHNSTELPTKSTA